MFGININTSKITPPTGTSQRKLASIIHFQAPHMTVEKRKQKSTCHESGGETDGEDTIPPGAIFDVEIEFV